MADGASIRPVELRCEYLRDPMGVGVSNPRLSWQLESVRAQRPGVRQSAFRITVASTEARLHTGEADLWDTGIVKSSRSLGIEYAGQPLSSSRTYNWSVQVWDENGIASDQRPVAQFAMGLLHSNEWRAQWIGLHEQPPIAELDANWIGYDGQGAALTEPDHFQYFRKEITLPERVAPARASITIAADNDAVIFINGSWISGVEGHDIARRIELPEIPAGRIAIAIMVGHHGGRVGPAALAAALEFNCVDGQRVRCKTDQSWLAADWVLPDWKKTGFDDTAWANARILKTASGANLPTPKSEAINGGPALWLRHDFSLRSYRRAIVHFSGVGWSELYLNGQRVGDEVLSPGLSDYRRRVISVSHDVTQFLRSGRNTVGVVLGNGRFLAPRPSAVNFGSPRLLLQIEVEDTDGGISYITTDQNWKLTEGGPITAQNEYDGERYDARLEMPGWSEPNFDDSSWSSAKSLAAPKGAIVASSMQPTRVVRTLSPIDIFPTEKNSYIFDFGQNLSGVCRLSVDVQPGTEITLRHSELLENGRLAVDNLRGAAATDQYVAKGGGPEVWQPRFTIHGFRYVELIGLQTRPGPSTLRACVIADDLPETGHFSCSSDLLTRIHQTIAWTVRANCRSIRTDCPQRDERQGWLGDPAEEAGGEAFTFWNASFYAKWVQDILDAQQPDGLIPDVVPPYWTTASDDVSWPAAIIAIPDMLSRHFGDQRTIASCLPQVIRWINHLRSKMVGNTIDSDSYGDWGAPPQDRAQTHQSPSEQITPGPLIATAYLIQCTERLLPYLEQSAMTADLENLRTLSQELRTGFHQRFFDSRNGWYGNGTATCCILPLAFALVPPEHIKTVAAKLVVELTKDGDAKPTFGLVGAQWVYRVLTQIGRSDLAYAIACRTAYPSYGYMLDNGATTLWELWNGDTAPAAMTSRNHTMLMGDLPLWLYSHIAGISPDFSSPENPRVAIHPHLVGDLTWAEGATATPAGRIRCFWRIEKNRLTVEIESPPNLTVEFTPPDGFSLLQMSHSPTRRQGGRFLINSGIQTLSLARSESNPPM